MTVIPQPNGPTPRVDRWRTPLTRAAALTAIGAFLLICHNYVSPFLPEREIVLSPGVMTPYSADKDKAHLFIYPFNRSEPNRPAAMRSRLVLTEDGVPFHAASHEPNEVFQVGGGRWLHQPGRVVFSVSYNLDPRTNGRLYSLRYPILYTRTVGHMACLVFGLAVAGLYFLGHRPVPPAPAPQPIARWRWHVAGGATLFLLGLYCNTGTLTPYAITTFAHREEATGYLYNPDHFHFRAMFDFVDGADRAKWDGAILLRRVLYPALAWPFMKLGGFEIGGTIASLLFNLAGYIWAVCLVRHRIGERGAVILLWLLALYPGAAYWGVLPYSYALIAPLSLLLLLALGMLAEAKGSRFVILALLMGLGFMAYDFAAFFLPATMLMLAWRRRFLAVPAALALMALPSVLWLLTLTHGLGQSLVNSNTATYQAIIDSYRNAGGITRWWAQVPEQFEPALGVFFGANFLFLPALFLAVVALNAVTSRVSLAGDEVCLLLAATAVYVFNHLAPEYGGWQMRGTWISRIYQPIFPVFLLFIARWWQHLPPMRRLGGAMASVTLGLAMAGNALVVFGPILGNPMKISETAFYRFYNHNTYHPIYMSNLRSFGRYPLGFGQPRPAAP